MTSLEERLARHRQSKALDALLAQMIGLEVIERDAEAFAFEAFEAWASDTGRLVAIPDAYLREQYNAGDAARLRDWFGGVHRDSSIAHHAQTEAIYFRTSLFWSAGWTGIRSSTPESTLWVLWQKLQHGNVYLTDASRTHPLVLSSIEHFWLAYWKQPVLLGQDSWWPQGLQ